MRSYRLTLIFTCAWLAACSASSLDSSGAGGGDVDAAGGTSSGGGASAGSGMWGAGGSGAGGSPATSGQGGPGGGGGASTGGATGAGGSKGTGGHSGTTSGDRYGTGGSASGGSSGKAGGAGLGGSAGLGGTSTDASAGPADSGQADGPDAEQDDYRACSYVGGIDRVTIAHCDRARGLSFQLVLLDPSEAASSGLKLPLPWGFGGGSTGDIESCGARVPSGTRATTVTGEVVARDDAGTMHSQLEVLDVDVTMTFPATDAGGPITERLQVEGLAVLPCP